MANTLTVESLTVTGTTTIASATSGSTVIDGSSDAIQLRVQGHSTQTNSIFVVEKSDGTDLVTVDNSGNVVMGQTGAATTMTMDGSTSCRLQVRRNTATASTGFFEAASGEINFGSLTNTAVKFYVNSGIVGSFLTTGVLETINGVKVKNTGAGSDTLSWYEEGTWTPAFVSSAGISASTMNGYFTRIGRVVHISGFASWTGAGSGTNDVTLSGLPYTVLNSTNFSARGIVETAGVTLPAGTHTIATAVGNTTTVKFVYNGSGVSSDWLDYEDMTGAGYLIFSLTYFV